MNLPNKLTVARFALTLAFLGAIYGGFPYHQTVALVLFSLAGLTDFLDGRLARRHKLITNFGILMDPLADKILVCSAFIAFVGLHLMEGWMVVIIVARELAITGLRLLAASQHVVLAAERYGKHKTISQIVAIIAILVAQSYRDWGAPWYRVFGWKIGNLAWSEWFAEAAKWVTVLLTLVSGGIYLWKNRQLFLKDL